VNRRDFALNERAAIAPNCCAATHTGRASNVWTKRCRNERFSRYWYMPDRQLRRQRLVLCFSRQIETSPALIATAARQRDHCESLIGELAPEFQQLRRVLAKVVPGARIPPMKDAGNFLAVR